MTDPASPPSPPPIETCSNCRKPTALCVCDRIVTFAPKLRVLILQHPQEIDVTLGTARIAELMLPKRVMVRPGLSWPSLAAAMGRDQVDLARWAILYPHSLPRDLTPAEEASRVVVLERRGEKRDLRALPLEGVIVLDGSWSQAKTLWWRNPWMVKLPRLVLHPTEPSAYGKVRKQPKRGFLSTLEAIAETMDALGEDAAIRKAMKATFRTLLQRARDQQVAEEARLPKRVKPKRDDAIF